MPTVVSQTREEVVFTDRQKARLTDQWWDMHQRLRAGSLNPDRVSRGVQLVIEDRWDKSGEKDGLPFANECVSSLYGYPAEFRFRAPAEQLEYWRGQKLTKELDGGHVLDLVRRIEDAGLPAGAENIGVWPKFSRLGGLYKAIEQIFFLIAVLRNFRNWRGDEVGKKEHWRHTIKTAGCFQRLDQYQPGDYFVVPFQFGKLWAGASIRHAQVRYAPMEFGLCPYSGGCLLLTHPDRIRGDNQLYLDLGGCEWSPRADGDFLISSYFCWDEGCIFSSRDTFNSYAFYGSGSAFAPQC